MGSDHVDRRSLSRAKYEAESTLKLLEGISGRMVHPDDVDDVVAEMDVLRDRVERIDRQLATLRE